MSPEDVVNSSLDQIRVASNVQSINPSDGSYAANVASRNYQPRMDALFRSAHWNCARFQAPLTILKAYQGTVYNPNGASPNPPNGWLYEYAYPAAPICLKVRFVFPWIGANAGATGNISLPSTPLTTGNIPMFPNSSAGGPRPVKFVVSTDLDANGNQIRVILCNSPYANAVYTARVDDPTLWDPSLLEAATGILAVWLAQPLSGNAQLAAAAGGMAKQAILTARISDGDEGFTSSDSTPDWIRIRDGGTSATSDVCYAGWDSISIPGVGAF